MCILDVNRLKYQTTILICTFCHLSRACCCCFRIYPPTTGTMSRWVSCWPRPSSSSTCSLMHPTTSEPNSHSTQYPHHQHQQQQPKGTTLLLHQKKLTFGSFMYCRIGNYSEWIILPNFFRVGSVRYNEGWMYNSCH